MVKYKKYKMKDLFEFKRGRVISKLYIEKHKGTYPLYSSAIDNYGIMDYIDTYDFDGLYITWGTDNIFTPRPRNGKFSCTNVCGTMKPLSSKWTFESLLYICGALQGKSKLFNWSEKASSIAISNLDVDLPVKTTLIPDYEIVRKFGGGGINNE